MPTCFADNAGVIKLILLNKGLEADEPAAHRSSSGEESSSKMDSFDNARALIAANCPALLATEVLNAASIRGNVLKPQFFR